MTHLCQGIDSNQLPRQLKVSNAHRTLSSWAVVRPSRLCDYAVLLLLLFHCYCCFYRYCDDATTSMTTTMKALGKGLKYLDFLSKLVDNLTGADGGGL